MLTPIAQAAPPDRAPANGYRRNQNNNRDNNWNQNRQGDVLTGRVTRVISSREFEISDSGRTYRITSDSYLNIERGDTVRVRGDLRGNTFRAEAVNIIDRNNNNWNDRWDNDRTNSTNFDGVIIERESSRELRVRASDGHVYTVRTDSNLPSSLNRGDTVRVAGAFTGTVVRNARVYEIRNNGGWGNNGGWNNGGNGGWNGGNGNWGNGNGGWNGGNGNWGNNNSNGWDTGDNVEFTGPLLTIRTDRDRAWVRGGDGRTHEIRLDGNRLDDFREGQIVRVRGIVRSDYVQVRSISRF